MKTFSVTGEIRKTLGKKEAQLLRGEGKVPCVLYGLDNPIHFYAHKNEFSKLVYTPSVYLVNITIEGKEHLAIMQDLQFDPVSDDLIHIDFLKVTDKKPIKVNIPVEVKGFAKGIKSGGKLQIQTRRLTIMALAQDLPDRIELDVTDLDLGQSIRVGAIQLDKITILNNKSVPVVRIMMTRAARAAAQQKEDAKGSKKKK